MPSASVGKLEACTFHSVREESYRPNCTGRRVSPDVSAGHHLKTRFASRTHRVLGFEEGLYDRKRHSCTHPTRVFFGSEDEFQSIMECVVRGHSDVATSGVGVQGQGA